MKGKLTSEVVSASSPQARHHVVPHQPEFAVPGKPVSLPALAWSARSPNKMLSKLAAKL